MPISASRLSSFNSRAHEGRDVSFSLNRLVRPCFNSRAHEGRDTFFAPNFGESGVSIHAPTRGATPILSVPLLITSFNSRAHEGRDTRRNNETLPSHCFNSRAHEGRDFVHRHDFADGYRFNSRAHEGRDTYDDDHVPTTCMFQFTRPRGARRRKSASRDSRLCFNSRAHEGRDPRAAHGDGRIIVSIHAPTRGATGGADAHAGRRMVSIHAPTRGATPGEPRGFAQD